MSDALMLYASFSGLTVSAHVVQYNLCCYFELSPSFGL